WGTYLAGNYINCERGELWSPKIDLSACAGSNVKLVFWHWYDFWWGDYGFNTYDDGGVVEISGDDGNNWNIAPRMPDPIAIFPVRGLFYRCDGPNFYVDRSPGFTNDSGGWVKAEFPIDAALRTSTFRVRFLYGTGVSSANDTPASSRPYARPGWYIDDV